MIIDGYEGKHDRKHPLGPDIVEELQALHLVDEDPPAEWKPKFDPDTFT